MTKQQSIDLYGTESYTAWGEPEAAQDFATKGGISGSVSGQPQSAEQVTPYLNTFQTNLLSSGEPETRDPALTSLIGTYAPALTGTTPTGGGGGYTPQTGYVGKSLSQLASEGQMIGRADLLAKALGIGENTPLEARTYNLLGSGQGGYDINPSDVGSGETQALLKLFSQAQAPTTTPTTTTAPGVPQPISRVEEFERLRTEMGVPDLEAYLTDLKTQEEFLYAELRARTGAERGKPVPLGVITGRVTEIERQQNERIDVVRRLKQTATDQLNVAYGVISTYVQYLGQDYQDATQAYNDAFQRNVTIYGLIADARGEAREEQKYAQQIASANLQTMVNAITSGNLSYDQLPSDQKLLINRLEAQAGLPVGLTASLKMNPQDTVLFETSNEGITQIGFMQEDGTVRVEEYGRRISSGGGTSTKIDTTEAMGFPDYVVKYAPTKGLDAIYTAYAQSPYGEQFGAPEENRYEISLLYKWAKGEISEEEYRIKMKEAGL